MNLYADDVYEPEEWEEGVWEWYVFKQMWQLRVDYVM